MAPVHFAVRDARLADAVRVEALLASKSSPRKGGVSMTKNLQPVRAILHALIRAYELEPGQKEATDKAIAKLMRGLEAGDITRVRAALGDLARVFIKTQ